MNVENKKRQRIFLNGRSLQARLFSFLLCLVLTLTYSGVYTLADNYDTPYFNRDKGTTDMVSAELVTTDMTALGEGSSDINPKWYVVKEAVTINDRITVTGNVHLILADNAVLTAKKGKIKLNIFYSPDKNEKADKLYVVYVNKKGRLRKVKGSVYDKKTGCMIFTAKNLGAFGVGYTAP